MVWIFGSVWGVWNQRLQWVLWCIQRHFWVQWRVWLLWIAWKHRAFWYERDVWR